MRVSVAGKDGELVSSAGDTGIHASHFEFTGANKIWFTEQLALIDDARRRQAVHPDDSARLSLRETQALVIIEALCKIQKQQGFVDDGAVQYLAQQIGCDVSAVDIMMRQFNEGSFNNNFYKFDMLQSLQSSFSMMLYPKFTSLSDWMMFNFKLFFSNVIAMLLTALTIGIIFLFLNFLDKGYPGNINVGLVVFIIIFAGRSSFFRSILGLMFPPRYLVQAALSRKLVR